MRITIEMQIITPFFFAAQFSMSSVVPRALCCNLFCCTYSPVASCMNVVPEKRHHNYLNIEP